jgi:hypothetical protein
MDSLDRVIVLVLCDAKFLTIAEGLLLLGMPAVVQPHER